LRPVKIQSICTKEELDCCACLANEHEEFTICSSAVKEIEEIAKKKRRSQKQNSYKCIKFLPSEVESHAIPVQ